jgi:hypothetical protein
MNREQKVALSIVITILAAIVASTIAIIILHQRVGMPKALKGLAFMGLSGLGCLSVFIFRKEKGKVTFLCLACMIPFCVMGGRALIPVRWLPQILGGTCITNLFFYSITIFCEYGFGNKGEKS